MYVTRDEAIIRARIEDTVMGMRLRVFLNPEEARTLQELRTATTVPQRVRDRARCETESCPPANGSKAQREARQRLQVRQGWHS